VHRRLSPITLVVTCFLASLAANQKAAEIRLAASPAVRAAIAEISQAFEKDTGIRVNAEYDVFAVIKRRIDAGERFDVVVLSPELIRDLVRARTLVPGTVSLGRQGIGLAARTGETLPDIRTAATLTQTLLSAQSIAYFREGTAGAHFLKVVERLGISSQLRGVLRGYDAAELERAARSGTVQYVAAGTATLRGISGLGEVAALPVNFQDYTAYVAGAFAAATDPAASALFLRYLTSPPGRKALISSGLELGTP
jgi:molybdate transport system substrate-binding protein